MSVPTIQQDRYFVLSAPLQGLDAEVRFKHIRLRVWDERMFEVTYNKGGVTLAYKYLSPLDLAQVFGAESPWVEVPAIVVGFAACSVADNFDRALGRSIAAKRLAKSQVVIVGEFNIRRLMTATDPLDVQDILAGAMKAQGLRIELCA